MYQDSFCNVLNYIATEYQVPLPTLVFRSGHFLRISIAQELKRQQNLGNPVADVFWDMIALVNNCFPDAGILCELYIGKERLSLAKETSARGKRTVEASNIHIVRSENEFTNLLLRLDNRIAIIQNSSGLFQIIHNPTHPVESVLENVSDYSTGFGYNLLIINDVKVNNDIPWSMLLYLGWTFERGEEPTEVEIESGYSAVSGWKAYARWMQGYLLAPKDRSIDPYLFEFPGKLLERRLLGIKYLAEYQTEELVINTEFKNLMKILNKSIEEIIKLQLLYDKNASYKDLRKQITEVYFTEQQTLAVFKQLKRLHHDLVTQRK